MAFAGNDRFSLLDPFGLDKPARIICQSRRAQILDSASGMPWPSTTVARHICSILDAQLPHLASYLETCRQPVTVIGDHSAF